MCVSCGGGWGYVCERVGVGGGMCVSVWGCVGVCV